MFRIPFLIVLGLVASVGSVRADEYRAAPLKRAAPISIQGYAQQNPACREWTDGCVICVSDGTHAHCSLPGIACQPAGLTCKRMVR